MKVITVIGTRPDIIKLSMVMKRLDEHVNHKIIHTGQNYDYELNEVFFNDLNVRKPDYFLDSADSTLSKTIANIIEKTDSLWTGVVQGGLHLDLLAKCAQKMSKMPFDVYALGSPTGLMENYGFAQLGKMIIRV